jgi:hypothetical protein
MDPDCSRPARSDNDRQIGHHYAMPTIALTRVVTASLGECELTHLLRVPIEVERARAQHAAYERALTEAGC